MIRCKFDYSTLEWYSQLTCNIIRNYLIGYPWNFPHLQDYETEGTDRIKRKSLLLFKAVRTACSNGPTVARSRTRKHRTDERTPVWLGIGTYSCVILTLFTWGWASSSVGRSDQGRESHRSWDNAVVRCNRRGQLTSRRCMGRGAGGRGQIAAKTSDTSRC